MIRWLSISRHPERLSPFGANIGKEIRHPERSEGSPEFSTASSDWRSLAMLGMTCGPLRLKNRKIIGYIVFWLFSTSLFAVNLGDMTVHSQLNEPFSADIVLTDIEGVPLSNLKPGLGTTEALDNAGLTQVLLAAGMHLQIEHRADGVAIIKLTSERPIHNPSLELLIDLAWPQGEVYRTYPITLAAPSLSSELPVIGDWVALQVAKNQVDKLTHQQHVLEEKLNTVLTESQHLHEQLQAIHSQKQHGRIIGWLIFLLVIGGAGGLLWKNRHRLMRKQHKVKKAVLQQPSTPSLDAEHVQNTGADLIIADQPELVKSQAALDTLLELSKTYFSRGDFQTAKQALREALAFGDEAQQAEAQALLQDVEMKDRDA